jgi:branched-chain amino acid transport system permease protein
MKISVWANVAADGNTVAVAKEGTARPRRRSHMLWLASCAAFVIVVALVAFGGNEFTLTMCTYIAIYGIAAVGQEWLIGRAGLVSFGGAAIMGVGAFVGYAVANEEPRLFFLSLLAAIVAGGLTGLVVGIVGLRFRGLYLVLSTLALQFVAAQVFQSYEGTAGPKSMPYPQIGSFAFDDPRSLFLLAAVALGLTLIVVTYLLGGRAGRIWRAVRENEVAAQVVGMNVRMARISAFVGSSCVTALAGCLFGYEIGSVDYNSFSLTLALSLVVMVYFGGIDSTFGPLLGAAAIAYLPYALNDLTGEFSSTSSIGSWLGQNAADLNAAISALLLILVLVYARRGLVGLPDLARRALRSLRRRR